MRDFSRLMSAASRAKYDAYTAGKSLSFLRKTGSQRIYNKLNQGSTGSMGNGSVDLYASYDSQQASDLADIGFTNTSRPKKSGITAIDQYYEGIDPANEVEYMRY